MLRKRKHNPILAAASDRDVIRLTGEVTIEAAAADSKGPRTFKVSAYTGVAMNIQGWGLPVVIDLAGLTAGKSVIANLHHERRSIVGHVTERVNDGRSLELGGKVSGTGPAAQEFLANNDNGFPWQASVEVTPTKTIEVAEGKTAMANGREFVGPLYIARKSKLFGVAFVDRGADQDTSVTVAASAASSKGTDMEFEKWIEAMELDLATLTDKQKAKLREKYDAEVKAAAAEAKVKAKGKGKVAAAADDDDDDETVVAKPEFRLDEIEAVADDHSANLETMFAQHEEKVPEKKASKFVAIKANARKDRRDLRAKAIKERWASTRLQIELIQAAHKAELEVLEILTPDGPAINGSQKDINGPVIEAALCMSLGVKGIEKQYKEQVLDTASTPQFRNMTLHQLLITAAAANGYQASPGERLTDMNLRTVLEFAFGRRTIHATNFSTVSLSTVLGNVANKMILQGYMDVEQNWREIAEVKSVPNFYQRTHVRMLDNAEFQLLGPAGEIQHGTLGQESYTSQVATRAIMLALTREQIINDDLGAFNDLRDRIGRGGARSFNNRFWTVFINNSSFFTTARANYITGGTTNLAVDGVGLELGVKAFRQLRTPAADGQKRVGQSVGGRPDRMLVPPELEFIADRLYASVLINTDGPDKNIHGNKYRPIVENRLSDSSFTGYSATAWYLFRNPSDMAPMCVSFLNGNQTPTVESADADFNTLGMQWRGYFDYGCDLAEYLAGIKSKGAA